MSGDRPKKRIEKERTCARSECDTKLNQYNLGEHCYPHTPKEIKLPRAPRGT